jgi:amidophosphoribosyltransferase
MKFFDIHDECGVVGVFNHPEAANVAYLGLYSFQHRGQEGAGICSSDGTQLYNEKSVGLVSEIFKEKRLRRLPGRSAIGHNRYSTAGSNVLKNVQPIMVNFALGSFAIAHNGNLINADRLRKELEAEGAIFQSTSDSEVIIHLTARSSANTAKERVIDAVNQIEGAFSLLILREKELIAVRDKFGIRPLSLGIIDTKGVHAYVVASETCAFDLLGAKFVRDIEPGEMLVISDAGLTSINAIKTKKKAHCVFEFIYFARPDSNIFGGVNVNEIRKELGRQLARECDIEGDIVIPVPDSGVPAAIGFSEQSGIPFDFGLIRNHYVGRTFIEPKQSIRHFGVKIKLNPVKELLRGKRVIVVDDSIVRGTTSKKIVKMIREGGEAKEVHLRISSPCTIGPCFYGINTPTRGELIASTHLVPEIQKFITADTLSYLTIDGLRGVVPEPDNYCYACFDNNYPMCFPDEGPTQMELFL